MANENDLVTVDVSLSGGGITRPGFGKGMLLSNTGNAWAEPELSRTYDGIDSVEDDFPEGTPEHAAATAYFGQPIRPSALIIGKGVNKPTQVKTIALSSVVDSTVYKIKIYNDGALWVASYTSGVSTDNDTIIAALVAAMTPDAWAAITGYSVGDRVLHDTGKIYEATVAGTSGGSATHATVTSAAGPFDFRALGSPNLRIAFNAGGDQDFDITAAAATKAGAAASFAWTGNFTFKINGGPLQTVTGVATASAAALVILINATIFDGRAVINAGNVDIVSDRKGTGATVQIVSVTDSVNACGFTAGTATGTGTVSDNGAVTATELASILSGITNGTAAAVAGALKLTSTTTGTGGTAQVKSASTADTAMGGEFATNAAKTGSAAGAGAGPTGTGTAITDGSVTWKYIATPNFTAAATGSGGSTVITATASAAGNWFALEPIASTNPTKVSNLMALTDATPDPGIASDLDEILDADTTWYGLLLLFKSDAILSTPSTGAAAWAQANERLLLASVSDTACATSADSVASDVLHNVKEEGGSYVAGMWHARDYEWFDAAKMGYWLPIEPGSDNWCRKTYVGVTPVTFTSSQKRNLNDRRAAFFYTMGSRNVDGGIGQVADASSYLFIDNRRNIDWYRVNAQADLVDLEFKDNKLAHTNAGIRKISAALRARNDIGIEKGIISPDPLDPDNNVTAPYTVTVPRSTDADTFDVNTRALSGVSTRWKLASPINSINVGVNVTQ